MSVLLDTGVLFAFLNADDARHREARDAVTRIAQGKWGTPYVSDYVVDELFTLIRARTASRALEAAAKALLPLPDPALPRLRMVAVGSDLVAPALRRFELHHRLSFTDASLLAVLDAHGIGRLATFDSALRGLAATVPE